LKQLLAKVTFSRVHVTRSVLTFVFDSTELRFVESVWSTSDSSRAAAGVIGGGVMIWLACGDCSRNHLTLYVLLLLTW
jgi:hypothetical protein